MLDFEQRITRLEALQPGVVPGTQIDRVLKESGGYHWCLALGGMRRPKNFYFGDTVEEAVAAAELELLTKT